MAGKPPEDLTGRRFGLLTVLALDHREKSGRHALWLCRCDCGAPHTARGTHLRSGRSASCGCAGYRRDPEAHRQARAKVPARTRRKIARMGAAARKGG